MEREDLDAEPRKASVTVQTSHAPGAWPASTASPLEFLAAPKDHGGYAVLYDHPGPWRFHKAVVRKPWEAEQTKAGVVTQWCLLVRVAMSDAEMEADGIVVIVNIRMCCAEHKAKATPWAYANWEEVRKDMVKDSNAEDLEAESAPREDVRLDKVK